MLLKKENKKKDAKKKNKWYFKES